MSELTPVLKQRFFDANGLPLAGGKLYSYVANSTTPQATYTDQGGLTPNSNPVILDANGQADVWLSNNYFKFVLTDANNVTQWSVDNVETLAGQIASQIALVGALAILNNLSDLNNVVTARSNLGIAPYLKQVPFTFTNNQAATNLTGEAFDGTAYTTVVYEYEIVQGTTIMATGNFSLHYKNGTWVFVDGMGRGDAHGITFSLSQATTIGQLKAAESGLGNGTLKLKKHLFTI